MDPIIPWLIASALVSAFFSASITWLFLRVTRIRIERESWKAARRYYENRPRPF